MPVMNQTLVTVVIFVLLLAMVPFGIKWIQARSGGAMPAVGAGTRLISAVAVGPHQRVVTVEVGPQDARTWLVLGVTPQSISCLHNIAARSGSGPERVGTDLPAALASRL